MSIITHKFRTNNTNDFKEDFDLSNYYIFVSSVNPSTTINSEFSTNEFLENTLFGKKVDPNEVFFMIDNNRWQYDTVYDQYDDKIDLTDKKFYAIVYPSDNSTGDYRVYKCLYNNHGAKSINAPNYDEFADDQVYRMGDGYVWKYMYAISEIDFRKYAALRYAPVMYKSSIITNVIGTGNFVTFYATNDFAPGMIATVRDVEPMQYNITDRAIVTANSSTFTVGGNETGTYVESSGVCYLKNRPLEGRSSIITNIVPTGSLVTFFASNDFKAGMTVSVRDVVPVQYNIADRTIVTANSSAFTVGGAETGTYVTSSGRGYVKNRPNGRSIDHIEVENYNVNKGYERREGEVGIVETNKINITSTNGNLSELQNYYAGQNFYVKDPNNEARVYIIDTYENVSRNTGIITLLDKDEFIEKDYDFEIFPRIEIKGDGSGAIAIPVVNDLGTIESTIVLNKGSGYTRATARIVTPANGFDTSSEFAADIEAIIRPILSPEDGHGYDFEKELLSRRVIVYTQLTNTDNLSIPSTNQYTKIGLVKNPEFISNTDLFDNRLELTLSSNILTVGEIVTQTLNNEITFTAEVHESSSSNTVYLCNYHGPYKTSGTGLDASGYIYDDIPINTSRKIISSQNQLLDINNIIRPEYVQKTGEVYYMTSFAPITRTSTSNEEYKIILEF